MNSFWLGAPSSALSTASGGKSSLENLHRIVWTYDSANERVCLWTCGVLSCALLESFAHSPLHMSSPIHLCSSALFSRYCFLRQFESPSSCGLALWFPSVPWAPFSVPTLSQAALEDCWQWCTIIIFAVIVGTNPHWLSPNHWWTHNPTKNFIHWPLLAHICT